jgi:hypothetical protein
MGAFLKTQNFKGSPEILKAKLRLPNAYYVFKNHLFKSHIFKSQTQIDHDAFWVCFFTF